MDDTFSLGARRNPLPSGIPSWKRPVDSAQTQRFHSKTRTVGYGNVYQRRYNSFPVESVSPRLIASSLLRSSTRKLPHVQDARGTGHGRAIAAPAGGCLLREARV